MFFNFRTQRHGFLSYELKRRDTERQSFILIPLCHPEWSEDVLLRTSFEKSRPIAQLAQLCVFSSFLATLLQDDKLDSYILHTLSS